MDSGSSPSVAAVNEANTKPTASSSSLPTPQIPPPPITVMMQQAIAMQQFQFQQALLMQQVMASQQAAARAATVKSAAEMAAARAAEISKQLIGSDVEEENEKTADRSASRSKSRSRSLSQSHSRSRSRSRSRLRSRSRSRSPIRYRRDRSLSDSPIRYRRDRYSPSRYRDHYGYRNRSHSRYRGYYRGGRGDYSWSYYRREWDRDRGRDYLSHVARRSRSRSRSRGRRRSRTHSQSPKYHREHILSPRHHREDRSAGRRSKRSRSRETKHNLSSRSSSASRESGSARKENKALLKGSLMPKPKVGDDSNHLEVYGDSIDNERSLSQKSSRHSSRTERKEKVNSVKHDKVPDSPVRSISVSLDPSSRIGKEQFDEDVNSTRHNRKLGHQHRRDLVDIEADELPSSTEEQVFDRMCLQPKTMSSDGLTLGVNGYNRGVTSLSLSKEYQREPGGWSEKVKRREQTGNLESSEDEMEDGKELDDWRDDIKAYEKEKAMRNESRKEAAKKEDDLIVDGVRFNSKGHKESSFQHYTNTSLDEDETNDNVIEMDQVASDGIEVSQDLNCEGIEDLGSLSDVKNSSYNSSYVAEEVGDRDIRQVPYPLSNSMHPVEKHGKTESEEHTYVSYNSDGGSKDANSHESAHEDREADLIYEGPVFAANENVCSQQQKSPLKHVKKKEVMDAEYKLDNSHDHDSTSQYKTPSGRDTLEEQSKHVTADDHVSRKRRGRERSAAKEDLKRVDEVHEKRKDRHKKHRRKHRRETSTEQDDDDYSSMDSEGRRGKKRHRRKHRKDDEERKERKKRRHKHRVKAVSCSRSQSLSLNDKDKVEIGTSTAYRKSSSRQKKRRKGTSKLASPSSDSEI